MGKLPLQPLVVLSACETDTNSLERSIPTLDLIMNREYVMHHPLSPLPDTEMNELLSNLMAQDGDISSHVLSSVIERAAGIPLYLICWAGAYASGIRRLPTRHSSRDDVPVFIRQQVNSLSDATQSILRQAALLGSSIKPSTIAQLTNNETSSEITRALRDATSVSLIEEHEFGYQFVHDTVRREVEAGLQVAERTELHRQAIGIYRDIDVDRAADHALHASSGDPALRAEAVALLELAGDNALAQYAFASAKHRYRVALRLARREEATRDSGRLNEKIATLKDMATGSLSTLNAINAIKS